jgi:hypothetical protein
VDLSLPGSEVALMAHGKKTAWVIFITFTFGEGRLRENTFDMKATFSHAASPLKQ